jgi:hypothetical protein
MKMLIQRITNSNVESIGVVDQLFQKSAYLDFACELAKHEENNVFGSIVNDDTLIGTMHKHTENKHTKVTGMFANGEVHHFYV